jgi:hypothetical protein
MNLPGKTVPAPSEDSARPTVDVVSVPKMHRLLDQAAQLAGSAGMAPDAFAGIAWQAYLRAFPEVAERMAEAQFNTALDALRTSGRMAKA